MAASLGEGARLFGLIVGAEQFQGAFDEAFERHGFDEVIIDALAFGVGLVTFSFIGGHHDDDRRIFVALDLFQDEESGAIGEHHVEDDEVWLALCAHMNRGITITDAHDISTFGEHGGDDGIANIFIIFDDEDAVAGEATFGGLVHGGCGIVGMW